MKGGSIFDPKYDYLRFFISVAAAVILNVAAMHIHLHSHTHLLH